MTDKSGGKPSEKPKSGPLTASFEDWLGFDRLLKRFTFFKVVFWSIIALVVLSFIARPQQQLLPGGGSVVGPSRQSQVQTQPVRQGVYIGLDSQWTQIELSAKPTSVFLPAQPFHLDIRPGGDCQGWLDLGYEKIPLSIGMPLLNRRIPVMVTVSGKGSIFFQAQPVRY